MFTKSGNKYVVNYIYKLKDRSLNQVLLGWQPIYRLWRTASPAQLARPHFLVVWSLSLTSLTIRVCVCECSCVLASMQLRTRMHLSYF